MHDATNQILLIYLMGINPKTPKMGKHTNSKVSTKKTFYKNLVNMLLDRGQLDKASAI